MELTTLDAIDLQLLDLLQRDAAQSNQALAQQVHVSAPTCLRRIKRLHTEGLIERRTHGDRRVGQDRRELPPRPEGRRRNGGRRASDPKDA